MPRPWRAPDNATIASVAKDYPNVVIADWNDGSQTVSVDDEMTDVSSERHRITKRTAACLAIDADT